MDSFLSMYHLFEVFNFKSVMKYNAYQQVQKWVFKAKNPCHQWILLDWNLMYFKG